MQLGPPMHGQLGKQFKLKKGEKNVLQMVKKNHPVR
jgi:hypothetical protein